MIIGDLIWNYAEGKSIARKAIPEVIKGVIYFQLVSEEKYKEFQNSLIKDNPEKFTLFLSAMYALAYYSYNEISRSGWHRRHTFEEKRSDDFWNNEIGEHPNPFGESYKVLNKGKKMHAEFSKEYTIIVGSLAEIFKAEKYFLKSHLDALHDKIDNVYLCESSAKRLEELYLPHYDKDFDETKDTQLFFNSILKI